MGSTATALGIKEGDDTSLGANGRSAVTMLSLKEGKRHDIELIDHQSLSWRLKE